MLWFHKNNEKNRTAINLELISERAEQYLNLHFQEQPPVVPETENIGHGHVQFQRWDNDDSGHVQQRTDLYDSDPVGNLLRSMSPSTPVSEVIKALDHYRNMTFVEKMLDYIDKRQLRESTVYKAAQVDRRLFSKIISDREYKPSKDTCVAFALALKLTLSEAEDLLSRAGYTLSHSNKRDVLIEFFFREKIYDLGNVNEVLYHLDQKLIGR